MMYPATQLFRLSVVLLVAAGLQACASPAEMQNMVVDQKSVVSASPSSPSRNSLRVTGVTGGESTNPLWTSEVDSPAFQGALQQSLERSGLLAKADADARFDVNAALGSVNQPLFGLDMTVSSAVMYRVVERQTRTEWFNDNVAASYTATFSDSALGVQRLRLANEGSIRENIKAFIARLVATPAPSASSSTAAPSASTETRLRELERLLKDGLIKKEDYDKKRQEILKGL